MRRAYPDAFLFRDITTKANRERLGGYVANPKTDDSYAECLQGIGGILQNRIRAKDNFSILRPYAEACLT